MLTKLVRDQVFHLGIVPLFHPQSFQLSQPHSQFARVCACVEVMRKTIFLTFEEVSGADR